MLSMRLLKVCLISGGAPTFNTAVALTALLWPAGGTAQTAHGHVRLGSIEVTIPYPTEIRIKRGEREWQVDISKLIRANDCMMPDQPAGRICQGPPRAPCPDCPRMISLVAWDEHRQKLYFALSTSFSWEQPFTIFNYNLITRRTSRFVNSSWAAALVDATVSANGQYLAYVKAHHQSAAGPGVPQTDVEIVDLWARRIADHVLTSPNPGGMYVIDELNWMSRSTLECVASLHAASTGAVVPGEPLLKRRIEVGSLVFR